MFISTNDIRLATKGLQEIQNQAVDDEVLQTFIDDGAALIITSLSKRYISPRVKTARNEMAWRVLATAQKYYCLMRLELYLKLEQPAGGDDLQIVDPVEYKKMYKDIIKGLSTGSIVLEGLERSGKTIVSSNPPSAYREGVPKW